MRRILPVLRRASRNQEALEADRAPEPFATAEQVLLCSFGLNQSTERSIAHLCKALIKVGFTTPAAREIIRTSPLIHRSSKATYQLRRLCMEQSVP
jgi:hypothetical protein